MARRVRDTNGRSPRVMSPCCNYQGTWDCTHSAVLLRLVSTNVCEETPTIFEPAKTQHDQCRVEEHNKDVHVVMLVLQSNWVLHGTCTSHRYLADHPLVFSYPLWLHFQAISTGRKAYALERGGDARRLVIHGARVRALAEKWGMGRVLKPAAIRELLNKLVDERWKSEPGAGKSGVLSAGEMT